MSTLRIEKKLKKLVARQNELLAELLRPPPMLRGSFSRVSTRCGKMTCWCAESSKGHLHNRITWSEQGKMITRKVPEGEIDRVKELTGSHRQYRKYRRELAQVQKELIEMIARLESTVNKKTRKPLSYLAVPPKS